MIQENGFRTPQRFTSKAELRQALAARGLEMRVEHKCIPGTDKSPYTTDWSKGSIDAYTLNAAAELTKRNGQAKATAPTQTTDGMRVSWTTKTGVFVDGSVRDE